MLPIPPPSTAGQGGRLGFLVRPGEPRVPSEAPTRQTHQSAGAEARGLQRCERSPCPGVRGASLDPGGKGQRWGGGLGKGRTAQWLEQFGGARQAGFRADPTLQGVHLEPRFPHV